MKACAQGARTPKTAQNASGAAAALPLTSRRPPCVTSAAYACPGAMYGRPAYQRRFPKELAPDQTPPAALGVPMAERTHTTGHGGGPPIVPLHGARPGTRLRPWPVHSFGPVFTASRRGKPGELACACYQAFKPPCPGRPGGSEIMRIALITDHVGLPQRRAEVGSDAEADAYPYDEDARVTAL